MLADVPKMVCSHCNAENPFFEDKKVKKKVNCISCSGILFELDEFAVSFRITQNFRIYYQSLSASLGELNLALMKKNDEINRQSAKARHGLWSSCMDEVFSGEILQSLQANADYLKNENVVSDPETRHSTNDYLENVYTLLEQIRRLKEEDDLLTGLGAVRGQCRQTREFAGMMNSYLGIR